MIDDLSNNVIYRKHKRLSELDDFDKWGLIQEWFEGFSDIQKQNILNTLHWRMGK